MALLALIANISAIATGLVAVVGYCWFLAERSRKRKVLEEYLRRASQNSKPGKRGQHSALHLIARLKLSEAEILQASFKSPRIKCRVAADPETGCADVLLFEYCPVQTNN
jgi:predicted LPLAT superfamily acyltransferase